MRSIRFRLFAILALVTALVWGGAVVWVQVQTRAEVQQMLDNRLVDSARMVSSLVRSGSIASAAPTDAPLQSDPADSQLSCQIWSVGGGLVDRSPGAPETRLSGEQGGFSDRVIEGQRWRVYTVHVAEAGVWVMIGDNMNVRDHLVGSVVRALLAPALLGLLALGLLIWWSVERGLAPIRSMADALAQRDADDLTAIRAPTGVRELRPFVAALNDLIARLDGARRREAEFTAAAAHELRTPLAGLRVQAQIAAGTEDAAVRERALSQIQTSVDRTAKLVSGLLALAREDETRLGDGDQRWVLAETLLAGAAAGDDRIEASLSGLELLVDPDRFETALRNIIANAQAQSCSVIRVGLTQVGRGWRLIIEDDGPGVPAEDLMRLGQRFYRAAGAPAGGAGLGLSIALAAVKAHGGAAHFLPSPLGGLRVEIILPPERVRRQGGI